MGGRHPGHYFMDSDDFNDIVTRNQVRVNSGLSESYALIVKVCPVSVKEDNVEVSRAGGVSSYQPVSGVLLCGGRNGANKVLGDCIQYNLTSHMVSVYCLIILVCPHTLLCSGPATARRWRPGRRLRWRCWTLGCSTWEVWG